MLGGRTPQQFMAEHWQKRPLFVPDAVPEAAAVIDVETLLDLAQHPEAESRKISQTQQGWQLDQGPFRARQLAGRQAWTVLVQGINHFLPEADALLRRFGFITYARLDDVMASYATPGGGVGPHYDSYDVFLIQARGTRRWEISAQTDRDLVPNQPLKIMADFRAQESFDCRPGDLLYLPPGYAHHGVALDDCITLSVGFRAPSNAELAREFLLWMAERVELPGLYADPNLAATDRPAAMPEAMVASVAATLAGVAWSADDVRRFLAQFLSEPKPHVVFEAPEDELNERDFVRAARASGVALDLQTLMLYDQGRVYCNGEPWLCSPQTAEALCRLADLRYLTADELEAPVAAALYPAYQAGHVHLAAAVD